MNRRNKRGSHIDAIVSFIVFIGIIVFLYMIIQPKIAAQQTKMEALNYIEIQVLNNISGNLTSVSVATAGASGSCFELQGFVSNAGTGQAGLKAHYNGLGYEANYSGDDAYVYDQSGGDLPEFFIVSGSPEFSLSSISAGSCQTLAYESGNENYSIGEARTDLYAFSGKVASLISDYDSSYNSLKSGFSIPAGTDFGFSFTYQNKTNIGTADKATSSNVYVESFPIQYVDDNGSVNAGNLIIRVW